MLTSLSVSLTHNPSPKQTITTKEARKPCSTKVLAFFSDSGSTHRMRARNRIKIQRVLGSKDKKNRARSVPNPNTEPMTPPASPSATPLIKQAAGLLISPPAMGKPLFPGSFSPSLQPPPSSPATGLLGSIAITTVFSETLPYVRSERSCACTKGKVVRREDGE